MANIHFATQYEAVTSAVDEIVGPHAQNLIVEPPTDESLALAATAGIALGRFLYQKGLPEKSGSLIWSNLSNLWNREAINLPHKAQEVITFAACEALRASDFKYVNAFAEEGAQV